MYAALQDNLRKAFNLLAFPPAPRRPYAQTFDFNIHADTDSRGLPAFLYMTTIINDGEEESEYNGKIVARVILIVAIAVFMITGAQNGSSLLATLFLFIPATVGLVMLLMLRGAEHFRKMHPFIQYFGHSCLRIAKDGEPVLQSNPFDLNIQNGGGSIRYNRQLTFSVGSNREIFEARPMMTMTFKREYDPWVIVARNGSGETLLVAVHSGSQAELLRLLTLLNEAFVVPYEANIQLLQPRSAPSPSPGPPRASDDDEKPDRL